MKGNWEDDMSKTVRIVLYVISLLTVAGLIGAFVAAGHAQQDEPVMQPEQTALDDAQPGAAEDTAESKQPQEAEDGAKSKQPQGGTGGEESGDTETIEPKGTEESGDADGAKPQPEGKEDEDVTILFTGDVLFANAFLAGYDAEGIGGVVEENLLAELNGADILMINNEFPFSDRGTPMPDKQFTFRCSPSYVTALTEMGVDIASVANNHTLDYGKEALSDTFTTLDGAGIRYAGAGETAERAEEVQIVEVNGKKYGFLAVSRVIPVGSWKVENSTPGIFSCYDDTRLIELVGQAKETCDFLAVYPHWGVEHQAYPEDYQKKIAQRCIEAGADVIVGSHTHCLQGVSYIDGKPVFYSLGNFIFGQSIDRSAILKVTVGADGSVNYELMPVYAAGGVTYLAEGDKAAQIWGYIDGISEAAVDADGRVAER